MKYLITGGAGFIGSNLVRHLASLGHQVVVLDKLTYAGNTQSIEGVKNCLFVNEDICNMSRESDNVIGKRESENVIPRRHAS